MIGIAVPKQRMEKKTMFHPVLKNVLSDGAGLGPIVLSGQLLCGFELLGVVAAQTIDMPAGCPNGQRIDD